MRKEIPQINETGNQARSKYFPSHAGANGQHSAQPVQKIKLQQDSALMNRDQNASKLLAQGSRSGQGYQQYKVQADSYNNFISNEEVKMGAPGSSSQIKKRNVI